MLTSAAKGRADPAYEGCCLVAHHFAKHVAYVFAPVNQVSVTVQLSMPLSHQEFFQLTTELLTPTGEVAARATRTFMPSPPSSLLFVR